MQPFGNEEIIKDIEKSSILENTNIKSFSEYIKFYRDKLNMPTKVLAKKLNIEYEQLRKIINFQRPTKKRDCIIAMCAVLQLDIEETKVALELYNKMPSLCEDCSRDDELMTILEAQSEDNKTISEINQILLEKGFEPLDIINSKKQIVLKNDTYEASPIRSRIISAETLISDPYDSLSTQYNPSNYICISRMNLHDKINNEFFMLVYKNPNDYLIQELNNLDKSRIYYSIEDTGDFQYYFENIKRSANYELKKIYKILNDTKNYYTRLSADILENKLHLYAETFNYYYPMVNEYYMFEYRNNKMILSIFNNSEFMHYYLSNDTYKEIYGNHNNTLIERFNSIEEITSNKGNARNKILQNSRAKIFRELKIQVDKLEEDILNKKQFIRRLDYIYEDKDRVCQYYGVEKKFDCTIKDEDIDYMVANNTSTNFSFDNIGTINITLNDLYLAFELGIDSIEEICRIKKETGSIEKILE